jgi:hypothetical protein
MYSEARNSLHKYLVTCPLRYKLVWHGIMGCSLHFAHSPHTYSYGTVLQLVGGAAPKPVDLNDNGDVMRHWRCDGQYSCVPPVPVLASPQFICYCDNCLDF